MAGGGFGAQRIERGNVHRIEDGDDLVGEQFLDGHLHWTPAHDAVSYGANTSEQIGAPMHTAPWRTNSGAENRSSRPFTRSRRLAWIALVTNCSVAPLCSTK